MAVVDEIILVDDCSTDGTRELIQGLADESPRILLHEYNQGKGAALRTGFRNATGGCFAVRSSKKSPSRRTASASSRKSPPRSPNWT